MRTPLKILVPRTALSSEFLLNTGHLRIVLSAVTRRNTASVHSSARPSAPTRATGTPVAGRPNSMNVIISPESGQIPAWIKKLLYVLVATMTGASRYPGLSPIQASGSANFVLPYPHCGQDKPLLSSNHMLNRNMSIGGLFTTM